MKPANLNPQQQRAVKTTRGRVLILAGAGSGKTSVLAHRIGYLIKEEGVPPEAILGLTFTNKAASEMRERVATLVSHKAAKGIVLSTFHSFCMQVLRKEIHHLGYTKQFSLYDERDIRRLLTQLARHELQQEGDLPSLESTIAKIAYAKSQGQNSIAAEETGASTWHASFAKELFERLAVCMRAYNAVDFDSLLTLTVELFEKFPQVLQKYQERFRYVMIDEYQDTNPVQYRLAQLLCAQHGNLCVVGDDDQSIYRWRGADIQHILQFQAESIIKLEQNYRSTPIILHAANALISRNSARHAKELWSAKAPGEPLVLFHAPTEVEEAQAVVDRIVRMRKEKGLKWSDMAILYRSNILSRTFETALMQTAWENEGKWIRGVPYRVFGGTEFYERSEIKDLVSYLKAIANPMDQEALLRIINVPRRGISENCLDQLTAFNRKNGVPLWNVLKEIAASSASELSAALSSRAKSGIASFVRLMEEAAARFQKRPLKAALDWLLLEINYEKAIEEEVKSEKMRSFKWENVQAFAASLQEYENQLHDEAPSLHHFVSTTLLDDDAFSTYRSEKKEDCLSLMTIHSAKGLEFTACYLVGLEDHLIPHERSTSKEEIEEERRLLYVAITRAKEYCTLSMARLRKRHGKETPSSPSRFLFEIPKELLKVTTWNQILN